MNGIVYGLYCICESCASTRPRLVRYVGVTTKSLEHRLRSHLNESDSTSVKAKDNWIRKHGKENIRAIVLEDGIDDVDALRVAEVVWIAKKDTFATEHGLNMTRGGDGVWGFRHSDETLLGFKGRTARQMATKHPRAKITEGDVRAILERGWAGESSSSIARDYPISGAAVLKILDGRNWKNVPRPPGVPIPPGKRRRSRVSRETKLAIWNEYKGYWGDLKRLAEKYDVCEATVSLIVNGKRGLPRKFQGVGE